ncbi:ATP-dependent zinc protease family protein [Vibrio sonorensis]|uniref:ATP-dependent zinc protease family protein n=1 Tax=Vibrio sonorensis TaxID=1004316 RepID=UPI0008D90AC9|nr:ATP-dependent zinc protease [Vibrio sonorensis]
MLKILSPAVALLLLSGCAINGSNQYHQQTLTAINNAQTATENRISNLELAISTQADYIESLENGLLTLQMSIDKIAHSSKTSNSSTKTSYLAKPKTNTAISDTVVLGEIEKVSIDSINQTFDARVDTGAATSSLNAIDIEHFERNGKKWVRFHLSDGASTSDDSNWIEAPIVRFVKIRQSTNDEGERRAVVELWVKVGSIHEKAQFTLADRSQMSHPVLLGREFIRDIAVVDVSRKYIHTNKNQK